MISPTLGADKVATLAGHADAVYTVTKGANDTEIISAGGDGMVAAWDLLQPELGQLAAQIPASVYALAFDKVLNLLAVGHNHDGVHLINWLDKTELASLSFTKSQVFSLCLAGDTLFAGTGDGILHAIRWPSLSLGPSWMLSDKSIRRIILNEPLNQLAIGASDGYITVINLTSKLIIKRWQAHASSVFALAYSPDNNELISGSRDAHLKTWATASDFMMRQDIVAHNYAINDIAFSPDGQYIATVSMDKAIKVWHYPTLKLLKVIDKARHAGHGTSVNAVYWTLFNNQLITASDDRKLSVWEIDFELLRQRTTL
jgi:WD40 repeat protein